MYILCWLIMDMTNHVDPILTDLYRNKWHSITLQCNSLKHRQLMLYNWVLWVSLDALCFDIIHILRTKTSRCVSKRPPVCHVDESCTKIIKGESRTAQTSQDSVLDIAYENTAICLIYFFLICINYSNISLSQMFYWVFCINNTLEINRH